MNTLKVAGDRIFISMHLCKEYTRRATANTDNDAKYLRKAPLKYSASVTVIALDSNKLNSCAFQVFNQNQ